jgi:hypothetical protein
MSGINADAVLVSVVADAVLLDPASIKVLLPQPFWLVSPSFWQLASLDCFVLRPRVSLFGNRDQCGINDLPATGLQSLGAQVLLKPFKKLIDHLVRVVFEPVADNTIVRETFTPETTHPIEAQRSGWQSILDRFKCYLETQP